MRPCATKPSVVAAFLIGLLFSPLAFGASAASAELAESPCSTVPTASEPSAAEPAPQPTPAEQPADVAPSEAPDAPPDPRPHVRFSEVFPDPAGADEQGEFIEIENVDAADADLAGWMIQNAAGRTFALSVRLGPRAQYAFAYAETKIALANSGTTLTLRDPHGDVIDTLTYAGPAKTGKTYARSADGTWQWTSTPTPGAQNGSEAAAGQPDPAPAPTSVETPPSATTSTAVVPAIAAPAPSAPIDVSIVAFLPDPVGDDAAEWIALRNDGQEPAALAGWKLDDAEGGSSPYPLDGTMIPPDATVRIARAISKVALNNGGDDVRLIDPDGVPRQTVTYMNAPEGKTYALMDGSWRWSTDGETATCADTLVAGSDVNAAEPPSTPPPLTAAPARSETASPEDAGAALLEIEGVVTLAPGIAGKRTFAMQDPSGSDGMFVRAYGPSPLPALAAGDRIRVTGHRASTASVLSTTGKRVRRLSAGKLEFEPLAVADASDDANGMAVAVTGIVSRRGRSSLLLADETLRGEISVRAGAKTPIDPRISVGATVTAKGVLRVRDGGNELIMIGKDGITIDAPPEPGRGVTDGAADQEKTPAGGAREFGKPLVLGHAAPDAASALAAGGVIAAGAAASVVIAIMAKRRRGEALGRMGSDR